MADCVSRLKNGVLGSMDAAGIEWMNFDDEWMPCGYNNEVYLKKIRN